MRTTERKREEVEKELKAELTKEEEETGRRETWIMCAEWSNGLSDCSRAPCTGSLALTT